MSTPPPENPGAPAPPEDDPLLTAYCMGELSTTEAAAVERRLAADPRARAHVEELKALQDALRGDLADEDLGLSIRQKQAIRQAIGARTSHARMRFPWLALACMVLGVVIALLMAYLMMTLRAKP